jgi:soluble lytic murein transglycosylase-like protein
MKNLFMIILVLASVTTIASTSRKKNYTKAVMNEIPAYEVEMKRQVVRYVTVAGNIAHDLKASPDLVIAVIWIESHFKAEATSQVGAKGLMQIMPKTRKALLTQMKNYNEIVSKYLNQGLSYKELEDIILGTYYLNDLKKQFKGNTELAIVAYNMGPTWVRKQLRRNFPVGKENNYLTKVKNKMIIIATAE